MPPSSPLRKFAAWQASARRNGARDPEAMVLATATRKGRPSARVVLYKGIRGTKENEEAIRFFTNYGSRKATELDENPHASLVFYWPEELRQIRISGRVRRTSDAESDGYWKTRPRESQIGAHASLQSRIMPSWAMFLRRVREITRKYRSQAVPRPVNWGGYHLIPDSIEFWTGRAGRLHYRERFVRSGKKWKQEKLYP